MKNKTNMIKMLCIKRIGNLFSSPRERRSRNSMGFTLMELILVILIIATVVVVGGRYRTYAIDAQKYRNTFNRMIAIKRALVGDERLNNLGMKVDFGYYERFGIFPPAGGGDTVPVGDLVDFLPPLPQPASYAPCEIYQRDDWGNFLYYRPTGASLAGSGYDAAEILCYGKDGSGGGGTTIFDRNFHILIRTDLFNNNLVLINVMDANGVILRGPVEPWDHQIAEIEFQPVLGGGALFSISGGEIAYANGLFTITNVPAGYYRMFVAPTDESDPTGSGGFFNHLDNLCGNVGHLCQLVPIYPKDPSMPNFLEFRFPGAVDVNDL